MFFFLMMYISLFSDFLSFSVKVSFSVIIGPTEWYLVLVKCVCLGQFAPTASDT